MRTPLVVLSALPLLLSACGGGSAPTSPSTPLVSGSLSAVAVPPSSTPADGLTAAIVTVSVVDSSGNPVRGQTVVISYTGAGRIRPSTATSDASGVVPFEIVADVPTTGTVSVVVNPGSAQVALDARPSVAFHAPSFAVGGVVQGLTGSGLVLSAPGFDDLAVAPGATRFALTPRVPTGTSYALRVKAHPEGQLCSVTVGEGTVDRGDVTTILVNCAFRWSSLATGEGHGAGVADDGTLWTWGSNLHGQLGDGTNRGVSAPVQVAVDFAAVAAGEAQTYAVKRDGTLWAWGANGQGQLGDGTTFDANRPVQIGSGFSTVSAGREHGVAIRADGTLWTWGASSSCTVGSGIPVPCPVPTQIGAASSASPPGRTTTWPSCRRLALGLGLEHEQPTRHREPGRRSPATAGGGRVRVRRGRKRTFARSQGRRDAVGLGRELLRAGRQRSAARHPCPSQSGKGSRPSPRVQALGGGEAGRNAVDLGSERVRSARKRDRAPVRRGRAVLVPTQVGSGFASVVSRGRHTLATRAASGALWSWGYNALGEIGRGAAARQLGPVRVGTG